MLVFLAPIMFIYVTVLCVPMKPLYTIVASQYLFLVSVGSFDIIHTDNYAHWRTVIDQSCAQYSPM